MSSMYEVLSNIKIADQTYQMIIKGDTSKITKPGQFINIKIDDGMRFFLRRPISICTFNDNEITIIYKILGKGTEVLAKKSIGEHLDILLPLGNGYDIKTTPKKQILIGGGIGVPPLYGLAKHLFKEKIDFDVVLGFNSSKEVFYEDEFKKYANKVHVATMDGSYGYKGNVIQLIKDMKLKFDYYYSCGPEKMLEALIREKYDGQLSFEERMGCGFGACMGCSKKTIDSYKRICKEGPVLESWEVFIDD